MADSQVNISVQAEVSQATASLKKISDSMGNIGKTTEGLSSKLMGIGKTLATAFAVDKIADFSMKLLNTTADLEAMDATFSQIFKGQEGVTALAQLQKQSKELGVNVDILKQGYIGFEGIFKGVGMTSGQAMESVAKATAIATDASAFYNLSIQDATDRMKSYIKGEYDGADVIGIVANESIIASYALKNYGVKFSDISEAQKELIRLDYAKHLQEQTGVMGQASRESGSWGVALENLNATWDRFLEKVGSPLLQQVTPVIQVITDQISSFDEKVKFVKDSWGKFMQIIADNITAIEIAGVVISALTIAILAFNASTIASAIASGAETVALTAMYITEGIATVATYALSTALAFLTSPITLVILALGALVIAGVLLYKHWDEVKAKASEVWSGISKAVQNEVDYLKGRLEDFKKWLGGLFSGIKTPHFEFNGSMNPVEWASKGMPQVDVKWNAKGGVFTQPTILGDQGVAEKGAEAIVPLTSSKAMSMIAGAITAYMPDNIPNGGDTVINNFNISGLTVREEADIEKISRDLYKLQQRESRRLGRSDR